MSEGKMTKCLFCNKYNGDGVEDTGGYDYYSCDKMNEIDLLQYKYYWSASNEVDENECTEYLGENCEFKDNIENFEKGLEIER